MSLFTPLRGSFMYAPMYVKCIEHLHIDDDNWKNGQKQKIAGWFVRKQNDLYKKHLVSFI